MASEGREIFPGQALKPFILAQTGLPMVKVKPPAGVEGVEAGVVVVGLEGDEADCTEKRREKEESFNKKGPEFV